MGSYPLSSRSVHVPIWAKSELTHLFVITLNSENKIESANKNMKLFCNYYMFSNTSDRIPQNP